MGISFRYELWIAFYIGLEFQENLASEGVYVKFIGLVKAVLGPDPMPIKNDDHRAAETASCLPFVYPFISTPC